MHNEDSLIFFANKFRVISWTIFHANGCVNFKTGAINPEISYWGHWNIFICQIPIKPL